MLDKYGMTNCKIEATPMATDTKLMKEDGSKPVDGTLYQSIIGSLIYASTATDISYFVGVLSKFDAAPIETYMTAAKRVLRYLKGTMDFGITFSKCDKPPIGLCDAN